MSENEILRRASYGPSSPVVGARGTRTRARIVATALGLFETQGFHGTSVDDIARAAGVSRATLYQYFESKEQIFVELLEECGTALMRVIRRIGPLGPTELGFDNLHWWLGEWAWVYDRYAPMFVQWATVTSPGTAIPPMVRRFSHAYHERIAERLASSGVTGIDPVDAAMVLTTLVNRCNHVRHVGLLGAVPRPAAEPPAGRGVPAGIPAFGHLTGHLAVILQLLLFPGTPPRVFEQLGREIPVPRRPRPGERPWREAMPERTPAPPSENRFEHLSSRAAATVRRLLDAGIRRFSENGYHQSSVDDIVTEAGYARGTFYKYFDEKLDLLVALSDEAAEMVADLDRQLRQIDLDAGRHPQLRQWLGDFIAFHLRYRGVTRIWLDQRPEHPRVDAVRRQVGERMRSGFSAVFGPTEGPYPQDPDTASIVFFTLLEQLPEAALEAAPDRSRDEIVELVATVIERALLPARGGDPGARPAGDPAARPAGTGIVQPRAAARASVDTSLRVG